MELEGQISYGLELAKVPETEWEYLASSLNGD